MTKAHLHLDPNLYACMLRKQLHSLIEISVPHEVVFANTDA